MRTTVTFDPDVAAEVDRVRTDEDIGVSEAVNRLIRRGMVASTARKKYVHAVESLGLKIDVSNIGEVLGLLDEGE